MSKIPTIFFYGIDNNNGGMENYALNLIRAIKEKNTNFNFHILTEYNDFAFKDIFLNELGCEFTVLPQKRKHPFKYKKALISVLRKTKENDFAHINVMSYRNFLLFSALKRCKIKTLIVGHATNTNNKLNYFVHKIFRHHYRNIGTKVGNNKQVIDYLYGKKCTNFQIVELGINSNNYAFDSKKRTEIRKELGLSENELAIGQIGRISKAKNQIFSLNVMNNLKHSKNIHLYIFGKGSNKKLNKYIAKNHLKNVQIMGETNKASEIYNALDLFWFPSLFESAGYALYEALSNGCPCISSNNVPLDEIKSDNLNVLPLVVNEWVNLTNKLLKEGRKECSVSIPSFESQVNKYLKIYENLSENSK